MAVIHSIPTQPAPNEPGANSTKATFSFRRILRSLSSDKDKHVSPQTRPEPTTIRTPDVDLQMIDNNIIARHGNVNINVNKVILDLKCSQEDSSGRLSQLNGVDSSASIGSPSAIDKLPRISRWDIQTEETIADTGSCRIYSGKVNGRSAIVKEYYGKEAQKNWLNTARLHAATHLFPQVLRLIGASDDTQVTDEETYLEFPPFLVFDDALSFPARLLREMMKPLRSGNIDLSPYTIGMMRMMLMKAEFVHTWAYLWQLLKISLTSKHTVELQLYVRFRSRYGFLAVQPMIGFDPCSAEPWTYGTISSTPLFRDFSSVWESLLLPCMAKPTVEDAERDFQDDHPCVACVKLPSLEFAALRDDYGLGRYLYPASIGTHYSRCQHPVFIFCLCDADNPPSTTEIIDNAKGNGSITQVEWEGLQSRRKCTSRACFQASAFRTMLLDAINSNVWATASPSINLRDCEEKSGLAEVR